MKRFAKRDNEVAEDAMAFLLTKPTSLDGLTETLGYGIGSGLVCEGDPAEASEDKPVILWAIGIETNDLKRAVTKHEPAPRTQEERPSFLDKPEDEQFTDDEIQQALRWLLRRGSA